MQPISIAQLLTSPPKSWWQKILLRITDKLSGIAELNRRYHQEGFCGLAPLEFTAQFIEAFKLRVRCDASQLQQIPPSGAAIVVANHPYGGVEGVVLANRLAQIRPDVKILANSGLRIFRELQPFFIFTNPLQTGAAGNAQSLRLCQQHLANQGLLVIFPAGRVSYPRHWHTPVTDHPWHRMVGALMQKYQCPVIPCFISGQNRPLFYRLGLIYYRFRLLMLIREMLAMEGKEVTLTLAKPIATLPPEHNDQLTTDLCRLLTYLQDPRFQRPWPKTTAIAMEEIANCQNPALLADEIAQLPANQQLIRYKHFVVCYCSLAQCPAIVEEIRRLREMSFRLFDEGSGAAQDGDGFDDSYTHLFVFDSQQNGIVGGYRMGQTDQLIKPDSLQGLYLSRMFDFSAGFVNRQRPCLEMGRSFVVPQQQRSFHGLLLLFKGIAAFVTQHPQYQTLYGTVSLSKQYQPLSVLLIEQFLVTKTTQVTAKLPFAHPQHHELTEYLTTHPKDINTLDWLVKQIEPDGKGLPVLVRQYHQLGAAFHCVGIDPNFAATPGLLLSVDLTSAPQRLLKLYFGDQLGKYMAAVADEAHGAPSV